MSSSSTIAMDYSHPFAPSNTTECVKYATRVLDNVEKLIEREADRDKSASEFFEEKEDDVRAYLKSSNDNISEEKVDLYVEYMRMLTEDVMTWYRSSKYGYIPEVAYQQILADCDIGIMEAEMEELERSLE
ncbi:MAG: hypothetical protein ACQEUN_14140 [Pseudomonadota bacterium]